MLEFKIDFNALQEARYIFQQGDTVLLLFISAAELLHDVERRLSSDFYPQLQTNGYYEFNKEDLFELARDPNCYALTTSARRALAGSKVTPDEVLNKIRQGFKNEGFSPTEGDLILYLVLQTRGGILNIIGGSLNAAFCSLFNPGEFKLRHVRNGSRLLQARKVGNVILVVLTDELTAAHESEKTWSLGSYSFQLQVGTRLLIRDAMLTVTHDSVALAVSNSLSAQGFPVVRGSDKVVCSLDSSGIATFIENSRDASAAKALMNLLAVYAQPERADYHSATKPERKGELGLCLDMIDICLDRKYEFDISLFPLSKLLTLLEDSKQLFTRELVTPQFFALSHFIDEILTVVRCHVEQFKTYVLSLKPEDVIDDNVDAIAAMIACIPLSDVSSMFKAIDSLKSATDLIDQFMLKLKYNFESAQEFQAYLQCLCDEYSHNDQYKDVVQKLVERSCALRLLEAASSTLIRTASGVVVDEDKVNLIAAKNAREVELREILINEILTEACKIIPLPTLSYNTPQDIQLNWNSIIMRHLEQELRNRLKGHVGISRFFLQWRVTPYKLDTAKREQLIDFILRKVSFFRKNSSSFTLPEPSSTSIGPR